MDVALLIIGLFFIGLSVFSFKDIKNEYAMISQPSRKSASDKRLRFRLSVGLLVGGIALVLGQLLAWVGWIKM